MDNPIIKYGKQVENFLARKKRAEAEARQAEILREIETIEKEFMEVFDSVLSDLTASGVKFLVSRQNDSTAINGHVIEFFTQYEGSKSAEDGYETRGVFVMEWSGKRHYRYNSGQQFGEWPVEDLLWNIYLKCFKED